MRTKKILAAAVFAVVVTAPQFVAAGSSVALCGGGPPVVCTTSGLDVNFNIVIPTTLRFQLGASAATPSVNWTTNIDATNLGSGTAIAAQTTTNGLGTGANDLYYQVISNQSTNSVNIQAVGSPLAGPASGGNNIPWTQITNAHTGGAGSYVLPDAGGSNSISAAGGTVNETGYVTYSFLNTITPVGGTYTGTITYTASQQQ